MGVNQFVSADRSSFVFFPNLAEFYFLINANNLCVMVAYSIGILWHLHVISNKIIGLHNINDVIWSYIEGVQYSVDNAQVSCSQRGPSVEYRVIVN